MLSHLKAQERTHTPVARAIGFLQNLFDVKKLFTQHSFYIEVVEEDNK
jgi:hypothetical protein